MLLWEVYVDVSVHSSLSFSLASHNGTDLFLVSLPVRTSSSSQAHSTQPILQDMDWQPEPPNPPFTSRRASSSSSLQGYFNSPFSSPSRSRNASPPPGIGHGQASGDSTVSLTVNYLPNKFSNPTLASAGARRRNRMAMAKGRRDLSPGEGIVPKMGGGIDAFRSGESRIGGPGDEDDEMEVEDGSGSRRFQKGTREKGHKKLRWNRFKWVLFCTNLTVCRFLIFFFSERLMQGSCSSPYTALLRSLSAF